MTILRSIHLLASLVLVSSTLGAAALGCGAGAPMAALANPPELTPKRTRCDAKKQDRPLVVEWPSADRAALESRAKQGLVAVRYEGCELEVLTRCEVKGAYGYTGLTPKRDRIVMKDADDLYANVPVYAAKLEGELQKSGELDVAMTIVGRYEAGRGAIAKSDLEGECQGATHVVTALTVGAFELSAGASAEVGAGATIAGAGAGARSTSQRAVLNRDGEPSACAKAAGDDRVPPFGCGALVRLEVEPIGDRENGGPACPDGTTWDGQRCAAAAGAVGATRGGVPAANANASARTATNGLSNASAKTSATGTVTPPRCFEDIAEAACDDAVRTAELGASLRDGGGGTKEPTKARETLARACEGGSVRGCVLFGEMLYQGKGGARDVGRAASLFSKACNADGPEGCADLAWCYEQGNGVERDSTKAVSLFERACTESAVVGCVGLGMMKRDGRGTGQDLTEARALFQRACDAGIGPGCLALNRMP